MLPFLLIAVSLFNSQPASMECVDTGEKIATAETLAVQGPGGVTAVLKVSREDDHSKNSHECNADYKLLISPAEGGTPMAVDILTSNGEYGRNLSFRLDGFSRDGKRIFGILSEGGKYPMVLMIDYDSATRNARLVDLIKLFAHSLTPGCVPMYDAAGKVETGEAVVELNSATVCAVAGRWIIDPSGSKVRRLPKGASIIGLYEDKAGI